MESSRGFTGHTLRKAHLDTQRPGASRDCQWCEYTTTQRNKRLPEKKRHHRSYFFPHMLVINVIRTYSLEAVKRWLMFWSHASLLAPLILTHSIPAKVEALMQAAGSWATRRKHKLKSFMINLAGSFWNVLCFNSVNCLSVLTFSADHTRGFSFSSRSP